MVFKKGYTLLIVDDSDNIRKVIKNTLSEEKLFAEFYEAADGLSGFKNMLDYAPDMVIVDLIMPCYDGFAFLKMKSANPQLNDIPVIVLTSKDDVSSKIESLGKGASDYITKPFNEKELLARIKIHLKIKILQDELKKTNAMLHKLSITDELTKIYNRRFLLQRFKEEYQRAIRYSEKLSLIIIDLDNFKQINDNYGHQTGDKVLIKVAKLMKEQLRACDVIGRYGGEEFVIVLPYTDSKGSYILAERIRASLENNCFTIAKNTITLTLSAGINSYPEKNSHSLEHFIKEADEALYKAKKLGKNQVCHSIGIIEE
ncbi:MAG: hypothetical protein A2Y62_15350 [Candidatus Fischerbacteria bacterium RBG_13_37_8]|uniref:Diguanylate cyclase response regulator n=1 Tax=Candidatus Fischerbacteria bacterium RBG_13_37_8 TaxID=1817863 RepID=A0A1F5VKP9_9BACT|nr:MAG: hypothetical protein A2Y62_15350 [Candidatus Fischerbacteria bacterium RBG_13_37_8]